MTLKFLDMSVAHDFAPGAEPTLLELAIWNLRTLMMLYPVPSAIALLLIAGAAAVLIWRVRRARRPEAAPDESALEADAEARRRALRALRLARQRDALGEPRPSEAAPAP